MACSASLRSAYIICSQELSHTFCLDYSATQQCRDISGSKLGFFFFCTKLLQDLKAATSKVNPPYLAAQVYFFFLVFHLQDRALILNVNFKREFT